MEQEHLPIGVQPHLTCFQCNLVVSNPSAILSQHVLREDHKPTAGLSDETLRTWVFRMNGWLFSILETMNLRAPEDLLEYVRTHYLQLELLPSPTSPPIYAEGRMLANMRAWEAINCGPVSENITAVPPSCLAALTYWKTIMRLMENLNVVDIRRITASQREVHIDGAIAASNSKVLRPMQVPRFIDSHVHPDRIVKRLGMSSWGEIFPKISSNFAGSLQYAVASQVFKSGWRKKQPLEQHPEFYFAIAIHPHRASDPDVFDDLPEMERLLGTPRVVAAGEMGLDYQEHEDEEVRARQRDLLERQVEIAVRHRLPPVIHCRDDQNSHQATDDCISILGPKLKKHYPLMLHSFAGSEAILRKWQAQWPRVYVSLSSSILHPVVEEHAAQGSHGPWWKTRCPVFDMVSYVQLESILIESDGPFLLPPGAKGKVNHPWLMGDLIRYIAFVKNMAPMQVMEETRRNACKFYGLPH